MKNQDNNSNNIQPATDWLLEEWPILKTQIPPRIIENSKQIDYFKHPSLFGKHSSITYNVYTE